MEKRFGSLNLKQLREELKKRNARISGRKSELVERSPSEVDNEDESCPSIWQECPDSILLHIFSFLEGFHLVCSSQTCKVWHRVSQDESLWKGLLQRKWKVKHHCLPPSKTSWKEEYKRLCYHTPTELSETLNGHTDEVLHVSFSHSGQLFSTTSKDATIKVWQVGYPTQMKYIQDFRQLLSWDFTQFSCFNLSDSMLLVSSVKTRDFIDRRGFVAILSILHDFQILRVVSMDPSQLFGAWLDDSTFLGGCLEISLDRFATTVQIESFQVENKVTPNLLVQDMNVEEGGGQNLFTFCSETASLIKFLTVANVPTDSELSADMDTDQTCSFGDSSDNDEDCVSKTVHCIKQDDSEHDFTCSGACGGEATWSSGIVGDTSYCTSSTCNQQDTGTSCTRDLIFVTGEFAVALHQLGFKNVSPSALESTVYQKLSSDGNINNNAQAAEADSPEHEESHMVVNFSNNDIQLRRIRKSDKPDHLIDLYGHVTGLCLSHDHRYLFLNCRPWIGKIDRTDPWATPDLSPSIEVRVIDLCTLKETGVKYTGHKGFSPSTMCCFVFLDVSQDYVGSGSEDAKGYLWDRHYSVNIATFEHGFGVVNAVAFNPVCQEYLVTVSDDNSIKIWRSKYLMKSLVVESCDYK